MRKSTTIGVPGITGIMPEITLTRIGKPLRTAYFHSQKIKDKNKLKFMHAYVRTRRCLSGQLKQFRKD